MMPSSPNLTVRASIADRLGSITTYTTSNINVIALDSAQLLEELAQAQALLGAASVNSSTLVYSLIVAAEAASNSATSFALRSQVLNLLASAAHAQGVLAESTAASMIQIMSHLSGNLTASQASGVLLLTEAIVNASVSMNQQTGSDTLKALEAALASKWWGQRRTNLRIYEVHLCQR